MKKKLIVGLTGIFGSGKTTVAHLLEELGAAVISADALAHEALWKDSPVYAEIRKRFPEVPETDQGLDRKKLAAIVFAEDKRRQELEKLIHPYVRQRMESEIVNAESPVVVLEVPLLFEAEFHWLCDVTLVVEASQAVIEKRLEEKGFSPAEIRSRMKAQMPLAEKVRRANHVVNNDKSLKETKAAVEKLWGEIKQLES